MRQLPDPGDEQPPAEPENGNDRDDGESLPEGYEPPQGPDNVGDDTGENVGPDDG